jgi:DNA-directed RNA polymerase specialized sigma24 family protein
MMQHPLCLFVLDATPSMFISPGGGENVNSGEDPNYLIAELYSRYSTIVKRTCGAILISDPKVRCQDAIQTTWENLYKATLKDPIEIARLMDSQEIKPFITQIARHASIDILRRDRFLPLAHAVNWEGMNESTDTPMLEDYLPEDRPSALLFHTRLEFDEIYRCVRVLLPKLQCQVLTFAIEGKSTEEISDILKIRANRVRKILEEVHGITKRMDRALRMLRGCLSTRQWQILFQALRGRQGRQIAQSMGISGSVVSRELKQIRKIFMSLLHGPWDDGGGRMKKATADNGVNSRSQEGGHSPLAADEGGLASALLQLPAFRELGLEGTEQECQSGDSDDQGDIRLLVKCLLRLPAFQEEEEGGDDSTGGSDQTDEADGAECDPLEGQHHAECQESIPWHLPVLLTRSIPGKQEALPTSKPAIYIVGRTAYGKSSLLNHLMLREITDNLPIPEPAQTMGDAAEREEKEAPQAPLSLSPEKPETDNLLFGMTRARQEYATMLPDQSRHQGAYILIDIGDDSNGDVVPAGTSSTRISSIWLWLNTCLGRLKIVDIGNTGVASAALSRLGWCVAVVAMTIWRLAYRTHTGKQHAITWRTHKKWWHNDPVPERAEREPGLPLTIGRPGGGATVQQTWGSIMQLPGLQWLYSRTTLRQGKKCECGKTPAVCSASYRHAHRWQPLALLRRIGADMVYDLRGQHLAMHFTTVMQGKLKNALTVAALS